MPTAVAEPKIVKPSILVPTTVRSVWTTTPLVTPQGFSPAAWANAGVMPIPEGFMMVENDANFLYVMLDLVNDKGNDPGVGDYFWLTFDVDGNAAITANVDLNYGIYPFLPINIGKQYCLGPGWWTTLSNDPTQSLAKQAFGPSPHSHVPHRLWGLKIDLKEVGIDFTHLLSLPVLHFGLRVSSTNPQFTSDFPPDFYENFSHLPGIVLATSAQFQSIGMPVVGVGLIPVGLPGSDGVDQTTGRATTASTYYLPVKNAAFGGVLNLIGDKSILQNLWNQGYQKYRVTLDASQQAVLQTWGNYHLKNNEWIYETFAPDSGGCYMMADPSATYSIDHLLFQWNTYNVATGIHALTIEFPDQAAVKPQVLKLMIDNTLPDVRILEIMYKQHAVAPCDIVNVDSGSDPVMINYRAYDVEGDVYRYGLEALYGHNADVTLIASTDPTNPATYPIDPTANPPKTYPTDGHGVADLWLYAPVNPKFPPQTCAYEFRLWATPNVVNGYSQIGYTEDTLHVTFQYPLTQNAPPPVKMKAKRNAGFGMKTTDGKTAKPIK